MKKLLLLAAVAMISAAGNAQDLSKADLMQKVKMSNTKAVAQQQIMSMDKAKKAPQRVIEDDCWYARPLGSMSYGFSLDGMGYYSAFNVVAPYMDYSFRNQNSRPMEAKWFIINSTGEVDLTDMVDEYNNLVYSSLGEHGYLIPHISNGTTSYYWGEDNRQNTASQTYGSSIHTFGDVSPLRFSDPHLGQDLVGWGYLDSKFLYGDGTLTDSIDGVEHHLQTYAAVQKFVKPMSPLYVENCHITLVTLDKEGNPLAEGEELTMTIRDADGNVLYVLTCGPEDIIIDDEPQATENGDLRAHTGVFTLKELDPLSGGMANAPFILDQAFTVVISGFEGKGIGLPGHVYSDLEAAEAKMDLSETTYGHRGYNLFYDVNDPEYRTRFTFLSAICIPITFEAIFDGVQVWEDAELNDGTEINDFNVLKISDDGESAENAGFAKANYVQANTASSWYDKNETDVYYIADYEDEFPEWILGYGVDNTYWEDYDPETEYPDPTVFIGFQCDPLPEGVEGRGAKLYIYGRGIKSKEPIYVLQGNYTKEQCDEDEKALGIENAIVSNQKTFAGRYNLAGQKVSKNFKGIVVENGKKIVIK